MTEPRFYKLDKEEVKYTPRARMKHEQCVLCKYYEGNRRCRIVKGGIAPGGWCKRFERK